jgi:DNA-binding CsgD family transcriptional regulator
VFFPTISRAESLEAAGEAFHGELVRRGYTVFNYGAVNYPGSMLSSMAPEWIERYVAEGLFRSDRLVCEARGRVAPFAVSDVLVDPPRTSAQQVMETAISAHQHGLVVPIHCPEAGFAVCAVFCEHDGAGFEALDARTRADVLLMSLTLHERAKTFYLRGPSFDKTHALSPREREALTWTARGKTSWEIAAILQITEATTNNHLASARRKLKVRSRSRRSPWPCGAG